VGNAACHSSPPSRVYLRPYAFIRGKGGKRREDSSGERKLPDH